MQLNRSNCATISHPERVIQFGEGNFLRGFVDWMIECANQKGVFDGSVVVVQPIPQGTVPLLNQQDGLYTLVSRGLVAGEPVVQQTVVTAISRGLNAYEDWEKVLACAEDPNIDILVSNTTEAGIVYQPTDTLEQNPPMSFPGKVCAYLYRRYTKFNGDPSKGMLILPCELIEANGDTLRKIVIKLAQQWQLEPGFVEWVRNANIFCNTLVDRIVTGYPGKEEAARLCANLGYTDELLVTSELFHLWVIEAPTGTSTRFPLHLADLQVKWVTDIKPYRTRKVRILNGAHTTTYALAYLAGCDYVREAAEDPMISEYMRSIIFREIIPTVNMDPKELADFANQVIERFRNPYIQHRWLDIALNGVAKFKTRVLPSLIPYLERNLVPPLLSLAFAGLIRFYRGCLTDQGLAGSYRGREYLVRDDRTVLELLNRIWDAAGDDYATAVKQVLAQEQLWGTDLSQYPALLKQIADYLSSIDTKGIRPTMQDALEGSRRSVDHA